MSSLDTLHCIVGGRVSHCIWSDRRNKNDWPARSRDPPLPQNWDYRGTPIHPLSTGYWRASSGSNAWVVSILMTELSLSSHNHGFV